MTILLMSTVFLLVSITGLGIIGLASFAVRQRTKQIGTRRAVGATPWTVMRQVVLESLILTGIAGYAGLLAGMGVMDLTNYFLLAGSDTGMFRNPEVSLVVVGKALLILVASGALAGMIPARRAVKIRPVEALRAI